MSYTAKQIIKALQKTHGMIYLAAEALGCEPKTVYNHINKNPTVKAALDNENEKMLDASELQLYSAVMDRNSWAVKYHLSTKGKSRGYVERIQVAGDAGNPVVIARAMTPEQRSAKRNELLAKLNGHEAEAGIHATDC